MTDHAKAMADALQSVLDCLEDYQECKASESARDALDAYRASEQPSTAVELPEPDTSVGCCRFLTHDDTHLYFVAYGDARAAEARRVALEEAADEADHWIGFDKTASDACADIAAAIRALITEE